MIRWSYKLGAPSGSPPPEPITLSGAKTHLNLVHSDDDDYVETLITAARQHVEDQYGVVIGTRSGVKLKTDQMRRPLRFPAYPVSALNEVKIDGEVQTLSDYTLDDGERPPALLPPDPIVLSDGTRNSVELDVDLGYASDNVPKPILQGLLILIADMYEHREAQVTLTLSANRTLQRLLQPYELMGV